MCEILFISPIMNPRSQRGIRLVRMVQLSAGKTSSPASPLVTGAANTIAFGESPLNPTVSNHSALVISCFTPPKLDSLDSETPGKINTHQISPTKNLSTKNYTPSSTSPDPRSQRGSRLVLMAQISACKSAALEPEYPGKLNDNQTSRIKRLAAWFPSPSSKSPGILRRIYQRRPFMQTTLNGLREAQYIYQYLSWSSMRSMSISLVCSISKAGISF